MSTRWGWFGAPGDAASWLALGGAAALTAVWLWQRRARAGGAEEARRAGDGATARGGGGTLQPQGGRRAPGEAPPWRALVALALLAGLLSAAYQHVYLRGGPRIIDAASYLLEARTFAAGAFTFALDGGVGFPGAPGAAVRGRFVVTTPDGLAGGVLFPPGWPALLAVATKAGAPLALGPLLAAALTVLTGLLGLRTAALGRLSVAPARVAVLAAALSALSAALRYHTADTMAHGLAAVLLCAALLGGLEARSTPRRSAALALAALGGLAAGWLVATRPVTGAVGVAVLGALLLAPAPWTGGRGGAGDGAGSGALGGERRGVPRGALALAATIGLAPGLLLLLAHQHALTGAWLGSTQLRYYALADGPPGCFRWGLGAGIGCWHEHGTFLEHRGTDDHGLREALRVTGYRLRWHALDGLNAEPLFLLVPWAAVRYARRAALGWLGPAVLALIAAYAGFYFDGSYPGGGARLLAEALPLEHVLVAALLGELGAGLPTLAIGLLGFSLHGSHEHRALRDREGGRPMFLAADLCTAGGLACGGPGATAPPRWDSDVRDVTPADAARAPLVFVDTDHGHHLAFDPGSAMLVARRRHDDHDRLLWERRGRPRALAHHFDFTTGRVAVEEITDRLAAGPAREWRFEAEAEWPPLAVAGGWAHPAPLAAPCASASAGLRLHAVDVAQPDAASRPSAASPSLDAASRPSAASPSLDAASRPSAASPRVTVEMELPAPGLEPWDVTVRFAHHEGGAATVSAEVLPGRGAPPRATAERHHDFGAAPCLELGLGPVALERAGNRLRVTATGGGVVVDAVELRR